MKKIIATAIVLASLSAAAANASPVRFHYNSKELHSSASVQALYQRINAIAESRCAQNDPKALWLQAAEEECAADIVNDIVAEIGNPGLTALHAQS